MRCSKKTGIALIVCLVFATLVSLALAFPGTSSTYSFGSSTQGVAGGDGTSATYSLRFTQTANQAGNANATTSSYNMNLGWFNLTYSAGVVTLAINSVECSNDTTNYYSCSQMAYNSNITHIKVNCSASGTNVTAVSFMLRNAPDSTYYVNQSNYTYNSGTAYTLNSSYKLQDSGEWNLTIACYSDAGNTTSNSTNWTLPWGWINVSLVSPNSSTNVTKDQFFTFSSRVSCVGGECGTANVTLDPYEVDSDAVVPEEVSSSDVQPTLKKITVLLEYKGGSQWDEDNDGIEVPAGAVDLTVEDTQFNWEAEESKLCTKWVVSSIGSGTDTIICNGAADCCALSSLAPESYFWNEPLYVFKGKYGAVDENTVTAQVIYLNQSVGDETYFESVLGDTASLPVRFAGANDSIENVAQVFDEGEKIQVEGKEIGEKVEDEPDYETHFVSIEQNDTALKLVFYHDARTAMRVRLVGDVERTMSNRYAEPFENITLIVDKVEGILPRFELHLGDESEVFQFGKVVPSVTIAGGQYSITDREDDKLDIDVVKGTERITITGVRNQQDISADMIPATEPIIKTDVAYVENVTDIEGATITLTAKETIAAIYYCTEFDAAAAKCAAWQKTDIPFVQEDGAIRFTVTHFSAYAGGTTNDTAYLIVWDETDPGMPNASQTKALNDSVLFFADYKVSANGTKITDGTCQIRFNGGNYTDMAYNATYAYYTYNRTFGTNGVYGFNVLCNHSTYARLNATDTISVPTTSKNGAVSTTAGATPFYTNSSNPQPCSVLRSGDSCTTSWDVNATGVLGTSHVFFVIYNMTSNTAYVASNQTSNVTLTISANDSTAPTIAETNVSPLVANTGATITIYATATDNVQVSTCWANITLPNSSVVQKTDVCTSAKTYTTDIAGIHNVTFYANDTSGNAATPASITFTVDTTAPGLNSTSSSVTASSATISYTANESVNASASYGTSSTSLTSTATETSYSASGTITLTSLSASTTYYYNITICDQAGNCATNGTYSFTTSASGGGSSGGGGGGGTSALTTCTPDWSCTSWSGCASSGSKTRICTDMNGCGDESDRPNEKASCIYVLPAKAKENKGQEVPAAQATVQETQLSTAQTATEATQSPDSQESASVVQVSPMTGEATKKKESDAVPLETGWWMLFLLVFAVIMVVLMLEIRWRRKLTPPSPPKLQK